MLAPQLMVDGAPDPWVETRALAEALPCPDAEIGHEEDGLASRLGAALALVMSMVGVGSLGTLLLWAFA